MLPSNVSGKTGAAQTFSVNSPQAEAEQLRRELARVKMERDILKKALGYFAKDPT